MRVLLKRWENKEFVWKNATYKAEKYYIIDKDTEYRIEETNIMAVEGHDGVGNVICRSCGAIIKNTPEDIEKHYVERENMRDCKQCKHVTFNKNIVKIERELIDNGDGTFNVTEKFNSELFCNAISYYRMPVSNPNISNTCAYHACRRNGVKQFDSVFVQYPGIFDTAITSDVLEEKKYKNEGYNGRYFIYDMKSRGTIKACVNSMGIVECFQISSRGDRLYFFYSEKYDKMFYEDYYKNKYIEGMPSWFREAKFEEAHNKIKALYEGASQE